MCVWEASIHVRIQGAPEMSKGEFVVLASPPRVLGVAVVLRNCLCKQAKPEFVPCSCPLARPIVEGLHDEGVCTLGHVADRALQDVCDPLVHEIRMPVKSVRETDAVMSKVRQVGERERGAKRRLDTGLERRDRIMPLGSSLPASPVIVASQE